MKPHTRARQLWCCTALAVVLISISKPGYADDESSSSTVAGHEDTTVLHAISSPHLTLDLVAGSQSAVMPATGAIAPARMDASVEDASIRINSAITPAQRPARRPIALIPLYATFVAFQILDVHSTRRALENGGVEMNPMIAPIARSGVFPAYKIAATTAFIVATERLRKTHPVAAMFVMTAMTSAYATIAAHNYVIAAR